ncbi:TonB-dependent receptor [Candidatus Nitrospira bockiana]
MTGRLLVYALLALSAPRLLSAHEPDEELTLPQVEVSIGRPGSASSQQFIPDREILLQPQGRPAYLLRLIPGFVSVEHSGGAGKADQYFLRGFDADHGTDIAFFVDGMPINLRSHAHGQGYTDLNFIIPETIQGVDVHKGTYDPRFGDFATAGAVTFITRDRLAEGILQSAGGQFDTQRHLLMLSPTRDRLRTFFAAEGYYTNGPFEHDNRYARFNGLAKATMNPTPRSELSLTGTFHTARWNASGEIPLRAVTGGLIDRFGAIDPSEGGRTTRATGRLNYHYDTPSGGTAFANLYAQSYRFDLFTNFTFFLDDPVHGDGIQQSDRRLLYGGDLGWRQAGELWGMAGAATLALETRVDDIHARLGTQVRRSPLGTITDTDILEASYAPYVKAEIQPLEWLRLAGGLRAAFFTFDVRNRCPSCPLTPAGRTDSAILTPKLNVILGPWRRTELFFNYGEGYHSNDARAAVSGGAALARGRGYELGLRTRPWAQAELTATLWALDLSSELVFVGDAGTTAARGATRRYGVEVGTRAQVFGPLFFTGSVTWTHAEFRTGEAIPLAPEVTAYGSVLLRWPEGLSSQLQILYLGVRPLTEDRSVRAPSWVDIDLIQRYVLPVKLSRGRLEAFLSIVNLLDTKWEQATFFFQSRLRQEAAPVEDIHFVPGTPRMVMGGVAWYF